MANWAKTIQPKSDQLNADDLIGGNRIIHIRDVRVSDAPDQPASVFYEGDNGKPWKPCKTMRKLMAHCWGLDESLFIGRSLELYRDESVTWAGEAVGGIRIKAMSHINERKRVSLQLSKNKKMPFSVDVLRVPEKASPPEPSAAPQIRENLAEEALKAANGGSEQYKAFFGGITKEERKALADEHDSLKAIAAKADEDVNY